MAMRNLHILVLILFICLHGQPIRTMFCQQKKPKMGDRAGGGGHLLRYKFVTPCSVSRPEPIFKLRAHCLREGIGP